MNKPFLLISTLLLILFNPVTAQNNDFEQIIVPLSNPGLPGFLEVIHYKGSIDVIGYEGNSVIVSANYRKTLKVSGMKLVPNASIKLSALEKDNKITIETNSHRRTIDLNIKVPDDFSLKLSTYDNGKIHIDKVNGEFEINNYNGDITLFDVSGTAVLSSVNGNILVVFNSVTPNLPMAFTSVQGNVDITLPSNINSNLKMKSDFGEIYTDFNLNIAKRETKTNKSEKTGLTKVALDDWTVGKINKGGQEILLKSFNGNIYIRKN